MSNHHKQTRMQYHAHTASQSNTYTTSATSYSLPSLILSKSTRDSQCRYKPRQHTIHMILTEYDTIQVDSRTKTDHVSWSKFTHRAHHTHILHSFHDYQNNAPHQSHSTQHLHSYSTTRYAPLHIRRTTPTYLYFIV